MKPEIVDSRFAPPSVGVHDFSMSKSGFVGIGAGYQFNSWLRADVTAEYRLESRFNFTDKYCAGTLGGAPVATPGTPCGGLVGNPLFNGQNGQNFYSGRMSSTVFLLNAYVDLGTWNGFTPFVGAGVGFANHRFYNLFESGLGDQYVAGVYTGTTGNAASFADRTKTNFAWALMAGVAYDITPAHKLELGYRYLNMGKGQQSLACPGTTCGDFVNYKDIDSHEFKVGFRWMLGGPTYTPGPAPYPAHVTKKF
ncbi:MAG: outer membrane protein, partial [Beijerinckiaceae bacterium]